MPQIQLKYTWKKLNKIKLILLECIQILNRRQLRQHRKWIEPFCNTEWGSPKLFRSARRADSATFVSGRHSRWVVTNFIQTERAPPCWNTAAREVQEQTTTTKRFSGLLWTDTLCLQLWHSLLYSRFKNNNVNSILLSSRMDINLKNSN